MELPFANGSVGSVDSHSSGSSSDLSGDFFSVRVRISELDLQNQLLFRRDRTIWFAKMQLLKSLSTPLADSLNYGFYLPPSHGKAGKFLEEERRFSDYPTDPSSMPFLEFKYKRRVYKQMKLDIKEVKKYHTKANIKTFFECVRTKNIEKINKMTAKCMDPNILEDGTGDTPLIIAATMNGSGDVIQALVSGGAHLDYRARDGRTAVHRAVEKGNQATLELLLDLGASPNYKDNKGLTPLYYNVQSGGSPMVAELLLKDRATVNVADTQGWREIHHACRYGRVQHLQLLIYYGASVNCQNEAGNTPLHVCAAYNQESAARLVLFRGADRTIKNKNSQSAFQIAIVSNNFALGEMIRNYSDDDVVRQQEVPSYSNRRRLSAAQAFPPGSLSRTTSEPFLTAGQPSVQRLQAGNRMSVASSSSFPDDESIPEEPDGPKRAGSVGSMGRSAGIARKVHRKIKDGKPSKLYICSKDYQAQEYGELTLTKGDYVKVVSIGEANFWEGEVGNSRGWFPSHCVHELTGKEKAQTMRERKAKYPESISGKKHPKEAEPRVVFVDRKKKGFGFVLRGAKSPQGATSEFRPTKDFPALQYLEHVDKGSPADKAGLKKGDFVLEINSQDVTVAPHQYVVSLVVNSPDTIVMKVITVPNSKALVWLNEARKNTVRKKPPSSSTQSLTKVTGERAQQEMQALNELDDAIAKGEKTPEGDTESPFASIRKRPISQKVSPEHLSGVFQKQTSAPAGIGDPPDTSPVPPPQQQQVSSSSERRPNSGCRKPVIPLAPSAFRFNTVARMSSAKSPGVPTATSIVAPMAAMETQTQFDDEEERQQQQQQQQRRRNSAGSDSALSSLRSSPASSYSYTTTVSNDSGVYTRSPPSDVASPTDTLLLAQVPPAPDYPAPMVPPAPSYPAPKQPAKLWTRSQSLHNLQCGDSPTGERRMSMDTKRPVKPPPPVPRRESSISDGNLAGANGATDKARPSSLDVTPHQEEPASPKPDPEGSSFANAIAAAAAKRKTLKKASSMDALDGKTPLQLALAARDQSLGAQNQNRNQNAETAGQGSPQLALSEAIARRKARLDASRDPAENIESKIRKYKQSDSAKGASANQALLTAIAKRRSTIDKQMSEDSDSQSTSSEGSSRHADVESRDPSAAGTIKDTEIAEAAASMHARLAGKPQAKEPATASFAGHKNVIKIVPRGDSGSKPGSPASQSPRERSDEDSPVSGHALKSSLEKNPKAEVYKHPLSPVKENDGDFLPPPPAEFMNTSGHQQPQQANGHASMDSPPQLPSLGDHRRERSFDTASVASSMSTMSTMSSFSNMSTEPSSDVFEQDNHDGDDEDDEDGRTGTLKSTSSASSNATVTSRNARPSPKVLPKPKRKSQLLGGEEQDQAPALPQAPPAPSEPAKEVLDNNGSLVINTAPSTDTSKHSLTSAWTEQGPNANGTEQADWQSKAVSAWTTQDVGLWLASLQLGEHRGSFEENEITGEHLRALTKEDLQELGVTRLGHRMTITKAIQKLDS